MRKWFLPLVVVASLVAAGCSDDDDDPDVDDVEDAADDVRDEASDVADEVEDEVDDMTDDLEVTAVDNSFDPDTIEAEAGATISVESDGSNPHTFTIDELDVDVDLPENGADGTAEIPDDTEAGDYTYYCEIHGEGTMSGTLTVT